MLKPQWWVNCKPLAEEAIKRTKAGELLITPKQSENDWYRWLEGIQDWCISRQLWWGHRCPAYFVRIEGVAEQDTGDDKHWVVGRTAEEARARAEVLAQGRKFVLEQDEDVLDTWFSSGLWPFSILGWPDQVRFVFLPMGRRLTRFKRHPILRNSTRQVCSKQDGTFSSSGSRGWCCSAHISPEPCPSKRSTATR